MLSEALQRNAKHEARLSNISDAAWERSRNDPEMMTWRVNDFAVVRLGFV
jgi:hypothetical protein